MQFISELPKDKNVAIRKLHLLIEKPEIEHELFEINGLKFLIDLINELETRSLPLERQLKIIEEVESKLAGELKSKFTTSLKKNPDLTEFRNPMDLEHRMLLEFIYSVSADVERSFSLLNTILTDRRLCLTENNLKSHLIIQHFHNYN